MPVADRSRRLGVVSRILLQEEPEVSELVEWHMSEDGVVFRLNSRAQHVCSQDEEIHIIAGGHELTADTLLLPVEQSLSAPTCVPASWRYLSLFRTSKKMPAYSPVSSSGWPRHSGAGMSNC